ncbi:MAG: DUF362 domain-containing protein [Candidatus Omnitrophota bacterium]
MAKVNPRVAVTKCLDYSIEETTQRLRQALDRLGGMASFVNRGDKVLLKPNLLMAVEPERAITTHPELLRATILLLREAGVEKIYIGDCPSNWGKPERIREVYQRTGINKVAQEENVELVELRSGSLRNGLPLATFLDYVDKVISLPKFKTHELMVMTGAVKNLFGLIPGLYKTEMHKRYFPADRFAVRLVDIYQAVRPCLNIVDAIEGLEGDGPGRKGAPRHIGLIIAGENAAAVDMIIARIMGLGPQEVPTIKECIRRGLPPLRREDIDVLGEDVGDVACAAFKLPQPSMIYRIPRSLFDILHRGISYWPQVNQGICNGCRRCREICPAKVITVEKKARINLKGCIKCFCCSEVCPRGAIATKKSLLARLLGLRG